MSRWPDDPDELEVLQRRIAEEDPPPWTPANGSTVGGSFVCFARGASGAGERGDRGWAAAVTMAHRRVAVSAVVEGEAGAPFLPGYLGAREGPLLEAAVAALDSSPDVLLVNATGRDHPRRVGLAVHLGWGLGVPTVGVTHRPLMAAGDWPMLRRGARYPLFISGVVVGHWVCTRDDARPLAVSAGWRVDPVTAAEVVLASCTRVRTPEPIRRARTLARTARSTAEA